MTQAEFEAILADTTKHIPTRIQWEADEDHFPSLEFKVELESTPGYPLIIKGSFNPLAQTLSYVLIHRLAGRIYALDLGKDHHNPTCERVAEKHKHTWREGLRDNSPMFRRIFRRNKAIRLVFGTSSVQRPV